MSQPSSPSHDKAVFISYARADDLQLPFQNTTQGWVTFFWHQLCFELTKCGVTSGDLMT